MKLDVMLPIVGLILVFTILFCGEQIKVENRRQAIQEEFESYETDDTELTPEQQEFADRVQHIFDQYHF